MTAASGSIAVFILSSLTALGVAAAAHSSTTTLAALAVAKPMPGPAITQSRTALSYSKIPMSFEPNVGQAAKDVNYVARGQGYSLSLTGSGAVLSLRGNADQVGGLDIQKGRHINAIPESIATATVSFHLLHAQASPKMQAERTQGSYSNYFIGSDRSKWHSHVPNYGAIRYQNVYQGIDWVLYGNPQQLEYDFVVQPGADPNQIRLGIEGADRLALDNQGDLLIKAKGRVVRQHKPVVYQTIDGTRKLVEGHYEIDAGQVAFNFGDYDRRQVLIIDPTLSYSTYLGGTGDDQAYAIALYSQDGKSYDTYVAGYTTSTDFPTASALNSKNGGNYDVFVAKLSADGSSLVYSTYLGGSGNDYAYGIAVDGSGNAYVAGSTTSTDFPISANPAQPTYGGGDSDAFVLELQSDGSVLTFSTYLGGSDSDVATAIALDGIGDPVVVGYTESADFPIKNPLDPKSSKNSGGQDVFLASFAPDGSSLDRSSYFGGSGDDYAFAIALDKFGNAYVAGSTTSTDFHTTTNAAQATHGGGNYDAFVAVLGSSLLYSTYLGGDGDDFARAIALDNNFDAYVAGYTGSTNFPTLNPLQSTLSGMQNAFVTKIIVADSDQQINGRLQYSTYVDGSGYDTANAIAVDSAGNAYIAGDTDSTDFPSVNPLQAANDGGYDAFITELKGDGSALVYATYLGGSASDSVNAIALDGAGNAYVAGATHSNDFPTAGPLQSVYGGGSHDAFVAKVTASLSDGTGNNSSPSSGGGSISRDLLFALTLIWAIRRRGRFHVG